MVIQNMKGCVYMSLTNNTALATREELDALTHAATQSTTQLSNLKSQVKATQDGFGGLTKAVNSLGVNGMDALSGTLSSVQGLFQSLGVELGSTSQRALSVATATTKLAGSFVKLSKIERVSKAMTALNDAWKEGIKNAGGLKKANSLGIEKLNLKAIGAGIKAVSFKASTIASKALGLALKAIPFVAVAAAIGALVAVGAHLVSWFLRGSESGNKFSQENERSAASIDRLGESIKSNRQAHEDNIRSVKATGQVNGGLINSLQSMHNKYRDLNVQEGLSEASRARIRNKVEQLNASIDGLNLTIDEETGLLTESSRLLLKQAGLYNDVNTARARAEVILCRLNQAQAEHAAKAVEYERLGKRRRDIMADENIGRIEQGRLLRDIRRQTDSLTEAKGELTAEIQDLGEMHADVYNELYQNVNTATEASIAFRAENERTAEAMEALNSSIDSNRQSHDDNMRSIEISNLRNQDLIGSLQELHEQGELDAAQRAHVRNKVEQLNESMEGLNLTIDEETGLLTESSQVLFEQTELYNDINTARANADEILARLNQAHEEAIEKGRELEIIDERRNRIIADQNLENDERILLLAELNEEEQALIETKGQLSDEIANLGNMHNLKKFI